VLNSKKEKIEDMIEYLEIIAPKKNVISSLKDEINKLKTIINTTKSAPLVNG
jgi:hypothetical protein